MFVKGPRKMAPLLSGSFGSVLWLGKAPSIVSFGFLSSNSCGAVDDNAGVDTITSQAIEYG